MSHDSYPDSLIKDILGRVRTIALVGASSNPVRPSYFVTKYLTDKGFTVIPVNPALAGQTLFGQTAYASLRDIPERPDMVDIFRNAEAAGPIADEAADLGIPVIWMQLGVRNDAAAERAEAKGATVIMNRCPKIEYARLFGEIGRQGINSNVITTKKRPVKAVKKLI